MRYNIVCEGLMLGYTGFAESIRNIALALDKAGNNVRTIIHDTAHDDARQDPKIRRLQELQSTAFEPGLPHVWFTSVGALQSHPGYYSIHYTVFETEKYPQELVPRLACLDEIWTPSTFCKNTMVEAGVKNVHVIPHGVDTDQFNPNVEPLPCPSVLAGTFKFLSIFMWSNRKGIDILVRAFAEEFSGQNDVSLYVKSGCYDERRARREVFNSIDDIRRYPQIHIDFTLYSLTDIARLYKLCDCFVMPTRGEGWGLEFSEAMSMAMPTVATNWGGQLEFMTPDNSYLIAINGTKPCPSIDWLTPLYVGANFADPSKDDLRRIMRHIYSNRGEAIAKGTRARQWMVERFTWDKAAEKVIARLNEVFEHV